MSLKDTLLKTIAEVMGECSNDFAPIFFLNLKKSLKNPATKTSSLIPCPQIVTAGNSSWNIILTIWFSL